jgi:hypothetical protein
MTQAMASQQEKDDKAFMNFASSENHAPQVHSKLLYG